MARRGENIYKRKDGRWEGRYKCGYNEVGKAKYRSIYGHSYAEVWEKLAPLKVSAPAKVSSCHLTVKELFDEWLSAVKLCVKPSTYSNYSMKVEKHISPVFGGQRYDSLTVQMLHGFIDDKLHLELSAKYVTDIIVVFKSMAKYAARIIKEAELHIRFVGISHVFASNLNVNYCLLAYQHNIVKI